jgi:beta-lactamase class A
MKLSLLACSLFLVSVACACGFATNVHKGNPSPAPAASSPTQTTEKPTQKPNDPELQKQIEQIAAAAKGHVGVAASVLETGESASLNPRDHFPMQSVYKLPIGMAVMKLVDAGTVKLDQKVPFAKSDFVRAGQYSPIRDQNPTGGELTVKELMGWMIMESDGTASDVLMNLAAGAAAVQTYLNELKINDWLVLNTEKEIGKDWQTQYRNWATPDAAVELLRSLQERRGLSEASQAFVLKLMVDSTRGPKRLKGLLPAGTMVAHKTGTSGSQKGLTAATNDIGLITLPNGHHLAIAVFVSDSPVDEAAREQVIAKIAKAVWDKWSTNK